MKTQHELIVEYVKEFGSIVPAKMGGKFYQGVMLGSELPKRCRELVKRGVLRREPDGKYKRFKLNEPEQVPLF